MLLDVLGRGQKRIECMHESDDGIVHAPVGFLSLKVPIFAHFSGENGVLLHAVGELLAVMKRRKVSGADVGQTQRCLFRNEAFARCPETTAERFQKLINRVKRAAWATSGQNN